MTEIQNKLLEITEAIKKNNCTHAGLLTGNCGIAIFLAYVNLIYNDANLNYEMETSLHKSFEKLAKEGSVHTFADGFAGICWGMNLLALQNKVEADVSSLFEEIEPYLVTTSENNLKVNFFDFIHGGLGAGIYFLDRLPDITARNHISKTILSIHQNAVFFGNDVKWSCIIQNNEGFEKVEYNLGLSHGIPSIIWFLSKCFQEKIEEEKCQFLITGAVQWILKQKLPAGYLSLYPSAIEDSTSYNHSRLGWCYGDLGIASCIWQAGKSLNNEKWKKEAIEIMLHASQRKEFKKNGIIDAGICHGTAGIAHIFNRFYFETKLEVFKETANYWINETLKMSTFEDGLAGFKTYRQENGWLNEYGLLEGIAGIGLVLLSHISDEEPTWDRCLLLS